MIPKTPSEEPFITSPQRPYFLFLGKNFKRRSASPHVAWRNVFCLAIIASLFASTYVFTLSYMRNRDYRPWITNYHSANRIPPEDCPENGRPNVLFRLLDWLLKKKYAPLSAVSIEGVQSKSSETHQTDPAATSSSSTSNRMSEHRFGLICNRVSACPKTRADLCRLKCAERMMDAAYAGPSQCGSHLPPPSSCAPEPPCVPPCRQCAPACLQPCRPCPPCPPPCRPCLPCPPNIAQPACSDYSHTTTESYPNRCAQIPCRWDNTSYYNEGNDPAGNVVRQWNTSCHFANRQSGGSCSQPSGQCHCTLSVPCQPCQQMQPIQEPMRGVIECQIPFRCRREVIITLPRDRCSPDRVAATTEQPTTAGTTPAIDIVTPTTILTSPGTSAMGTSAAGTSAAGTTAAGTTRGGTSRRPKGKAGGRKASKGQRTPGRKPSTGKRPGKSPRAKKSPKKSPGKKSPKSPRKPRSPRKKSPGGGRRGSGAKKMSQAKQIIFSCQGPSDARDYAVLRGSMDTSLFSNRSSQLRWMENRRRLCTLNRRNQARNRSSSDLYRGEIDWKTEPEFEQTDTTSSYLRRKQGHERAARQMKKWMGPTSHA